MALVVKDRVKEVTTTTGTSNLTLGGAVYGFQSFSVIGNGNTTYYGIYDSATGDWEVGVGTYSTTGPTLTRDTVLESSNSGSKVVFGAGTKDVFVTYPAERSVYLDAAGSAVTVLDVGTLGVSTANISTANITAGTISTTPTSSNDLVNKTYVDAIAAQGISYHTPVKYEVPDTTGNLNATYNNGASGVGATLTNAGTQAPFAPDGPTAQVGDRILIYNQTNAAQNGVYQVTVVGTASTNWVLTRTSDANTYGVKDPNALGAGDAFYVTSGNTGAGETYVCNTAGTITFGTTAITFAQISSAQVYSAGAGLTLSNLQFSITPVGTASTYGSSSSVPVFTTNAYGQVTSVTNTGIAISAGAVSGLAPSATTDTTNASNITSGTLGSARLTGSYTGITGVGTLTAGTWNASTIGAAYGGTGITSYTVGDILYADGSTSLAKLADVATGNALLSGGVGTAPAWGKIGLQTHVSGTLQVTNGGTGATTASGARTNLGLVIGTDVPSPTGTGASGTWGINISGNAATATTATTSTTATQVSNSVTFNNSGTGAASGNGFNGSSALTVSYNTIGAPSTTGTNASGTWSISISGNAATASNASQLGGKPPQDAPGANTIPTRDGSGYVYFNYINSNTGNSENPTVSQVIVTNGSDNFYRKASVAHLTSSLSGTAPINITGSAGSSTTSTYATYISNISLGSGSVNVNYAASAVLRTESGSGAALAYAPVLHVAAGDTMWQAQGTYGSSGDGTLYFRQGYNGSWGNWLTMLSSYNYNNYAPTLTGTGASGTWSINITGSAGSTTGNAATATRVTGGNLTPAGTSFNNALISAGGSNRVVTFDGNGSTPSVWWSNGSRAYGAIDAQDPGLTFWANNGSSWQQQMAVNYGNITINTDIRSPIFYDSNDTGYYIDPNSTSDTALRMRGGALFGPNQTWGAYLYVGTNGNVSGTATVATTNGNLHLDPASGASTYLNYYAGSNVYFGNGASGGVYAQIANDGSFRSPIYYDYNNTAYYCDPAGFSNMGSLTLNGSAYFYPNNWIGLGGDYGIYNYSAGGNGAHFLANQTSSYGAWRTIGSRNGWAGIYDTFSAVNGIMYAANGDGGAYREASGRWYFYYSLGNDCMGIGTSSTSSTYSLYLTKGVYAQSRIDATIFYDTNDTAYYADPASTSSLSSILVGYNSASPYVYDVASTGSLTFGTTSNTANYSIKTVLENYNGNYSKLSLYWYTGIRYYASNYYSGHRFYDIDGTQYLSIGSGASQQGVIANYNMQAPIFYDSSDTNYYVDPNSNSRLVNLGLGGVTPDVRLSVSGDGHISSYLYLGGTAGSAGSWSARMYSSGGATYINTNTFEVNRVGYGGSTVFSTDTSGNTFSATSSRAPIFYDTDNTGYYVDPNGTSYCNNFTANGGTFYGATYFNSNLGGYSGSLSNPALQAYATGGNSAFFSWHRSGNYAVNMGLDADNVLRIGGWSASANRFQMDMSGNLTMAGSVTAYSDERLKKDWADLSDDFIERLASVKAGTYTRIDSGERQAGSSAQDWQELLPEVVSEDAAGTLALAYGNAAVVACVELAKSVVALRAEIKALRAH